jgi:hypothetical protein
MEVEIKKEQKVENKIYFEIVPTDPELKDSFSFGKEVIVDFSDATKIEEERTKAMEEAKEQFILLNNQQ